MSLVGETKVSILLELADGPKHGYQIADNLDISKGGVYNHIQDLKEEGMITLLEKQEGGRGQKTYEITENGRLLLEALGEQ
ncbi:PadR family transcriptional regulator [Haloplanus natans]|uniref:PadR family transcriptional regulator n=1 Tax=Haloplanus natans TaxID=376171 RepID=UPI000677F9B2|nr:winged helix-turn-helix domain-containing protein [Haloplanus natans]